MSSWSGAGASPAAGSGASRSANLILFIAATAKLNDLTVVTRNVTDFEHAGVRVLNPWEYRVA